MSSQSMQWQFRRTKANCIPPEPSSLAAIVALAVIAALVVAALFVIPV